jgi:hypothetical protein
MWNSEGKFFENVRARAERNKGMGAEAHVCVYVNTWLITAVGSVRDSSYTSGSRTALGSNSLARALYKWNGWGIRIAERGNGQKGCVRQSVHGDENVINKDVDTN